MDQEDLVTTESNDSTSQVQDSGDTQENTESKTDETSEPKKTTRDHLSEAFDRLKQEGEDKGKAKADQSGKGNRKVEGPKPDAKDGKDAKTSKDTPKTVPDAVQGDEIDPITGRKLEPVKVPTSLPASLRETWKDMPRAHQEYWAKRELDMAQNYGRLGAGAKFAESIQNAAKPIEAFLKQSGLQLDKVTQGLYADAAVLWTGTPQQKAQMIHQIIKTTNPDMKVLAALAKGQNVNIPKPNKPIDIEAEVEKRIREREQKNVETQSNSVIEVFKNDSANEFANDVEQQMATAITGGFIETQGKTQEEILKSAYDFAVKNHPEIQRILAARGQGNGTQPVNQQPTGNKNVVKPIRSAKSSLGGGIPSKGPTKKFGNTRAAALDAWDQVYGGK